MAEAYEGRKSATPAGAKGVLVTARRDLATLTKARLSLLVLVTTLCGYLAATISGGVFHWGILIHTLIGTLLAAFGSAVFNQLMEVDADARMFRTADRPLPARRLPAGVAFVFGWLLAAFGILHLAMKVNPVAASLAAATLFVYLFIYTPVKMRSAWNTVIGAVAGALPPLIGWAAGDGKLLSWGAAFLFMLLFLWQLPHFVAINWLYREEYERGGFVMWSNGDVSGARSGKLMVIFSIATAALPLLPVITGVTDPWFAVPGIAIGLVLVWLSLKFHRDRERRQARTVFFFTLLYLPLVLGFALGAWR